MKRTAAVLSIALLGCASSSWDSAVRDANEAGQPLIVEFYADWCGPCKWFERTVLPTADVQAELKKVTFRRYDFDSTAGRRYARGLGVNAVPMFVVVDEGGAPVGGLRGAAGEERFLSFLRWAQEEKRARQGLPAN